MASATLVFSVPDKLDIFCHAAPAPIPTWERSAKTKSRGRQAAVYADGALVASSRRLVTTEPVLPGVQVAEEDHEDNLLHS